MKKITRLVLPFVFVMDFLLPAPTACAQDISYPPPPIPTRYIEGLSIEGGGAFPALWGIGVMVPLATGFGVGLTAQGTYDGVTPPEAPTSNVVTYNFVLGYGIPNWNSFFKGSGIRGSFGVGADDRRYANMPFQYGIAAILSGTMIRLGNVSFALYLKPQATFLATSLDQHGSMGYEVTRTLQLDYGGRISYAFRE